MNWMFTLFAAILCMSVLGDEIQSTPLKSKPPPPPPFDADLFRRDVQCFSLRGEFLYWRVQEGAVDYALSMTQNGWGPAECFAQGKYKSATFNGDPGFRFTLAFFRAPRYWEFWTQYTCLSASGSNASAKPSQPTEYLTGTWPQIFTRPIANAKSYIHFNYNVVDIFVTRVFFPNPHLRLRFQGGGVVAWMNQFWKVQYFDWSSFETKIGNRWRFIGGGLRLGVSVDWYWFENIYMTGGTTFSTLLGSYRNSSLQTTNFQPGPSFNPSLPIRNTCFKDIRSAFETQFYIGPAYEKNFEHQRFEFFVGYEVVSWMNLQETFRSTNGAPSDPKETWVNTSTIALQGLTARAVLDF
ncbi:MAG TPA: Lpg1974 family pore-forming outer membrane protein [Chlamydiales bacterium]|nr:Lpg1974 family pore-forming outer membrane protein [Chlamydiales bacterium]